MTITELRKKIVCLLLLFSWLTSSVILPIPTVSAHNISANISPANQQLLLQALSLDPDFDGISSIVEQGGWYNALGGPYVTNPSLADSDGDGLSDGEEQLYDTHPLDWKSPGLYVEYQPNYQTQKFYPWQQHGSKFIAHSEASSSTRDVIVRRGRNLFVGGPQGAKLNITPNGNLTSLSAVQNSCTSGWTISIPSNATVGKYTLTVTKDGWTSNAVTLYVIFELDGANQDDIDVLAYNERAPDHPNYLKDEIAIYFDTSYEDYDPDYDPNNHAVYGWGIGWQTDYLTRNVFENYVMPTINGYTNRSDATTALGRKVDRTLTIDWFKFPNSTQNALNWQVSDCTGHASLLTTFLRSAGLTSRPVVVDWKNSHYDTATEVWLGNSWRVMRAYRPSEYQGSGDPPSPPLAGGINSLESRRSWGSNHYSASASDMLLVAGTDWQWDHININYNGRALRDYLTARPGQFNTIKRWNWVQTPLKEYWGINPPRVTADCSTCGSAPIGTSALEVNRAVAPSNFQVHPELAHLKRIVSDYGVDLDGDGRYDQLVIEVELEVTRAGNYTIGAVLNDTNPETRLGGMVDGITGAQVYGAWEAGVHTVKLAFGGKSISDKEVAGPYLVDQLWISPLQNPAPYEVMEHLVDYQNPNYLTQPYGLDNFENGGAALTSSYSQQPFDGNGDGYVDGLRVNTTLNMNEGGNYRVVADLVDSQGQGVETAEWSGTNGQVVLEFTSLLSEITPYYLNHVFLYRDDRLIDSAEGTPGVYSIGPLYNVGLNAAAVVTPTVTLVTPVDSNGNGKYDSLNFYVNLTIPVAGEYRLEGWLESKDGSPISWQTSVPVSLPVGGQQLSLSFPGQAINALKANGPYQLVALKVLQGVYTVIDQVPLAYKTPAYVFTDFENSGETGDYSMQDTGDPNNWDMSATTWGLTNRTAYSPSYSWSDSPNGNYQPGSTALTSKPFAINNGAALTLSFQTCYNIKTDGDQGKIQIKNSQGNWVDFNGPAYTGVTNGWVPQQVSTLPIFGTSSIQFRFLMNANNSGSADGWYVDNVAVTLDYDLDNDGLPNDIELGPDPNNPPDSDEDGIPDYLDADGDIYLPLIRKNQ